MQTILETTAPRKPVMFYAHLFDTAGALVKVNGILTFVGDDGSVLEVEPSMCNFLTVLGACTLADRQHYDDLLRGGAPWLATHRQMEVA